MDLKVLDYIYGALLWSEYRHRHNVRGAILYVYQ